MAYLSFPGPAPGYQGMGAGSGSAAQAAARLSAEGAAKVSGRAPPAQQTSGSAASAASYSAAASAASVSSRAAPPQRTSGSAFDSASYAARASAAKASGQSVEAQEPRYRAASSFGPSSAQAPRSFGPSSAQAQAQEPEEDYVPPPPFAFRPSSDRGPRRSLLAPLSPGIQLRPLSMPAVPPLVAGQTSKLGRYALVGAGIAALGFVGWLIVRKARG